MSGKAEILVTGLLPQSVDQQLKARFAVKNVDLQREGAASLLDALGNARAIVVIPGDPVDATLINALPAHIGLIASYSTGLDHIDVTAAHACGIRVTNTPDVLTDATADVAMLLLLGALRGATTAISLVRSGQWSGWQPAQIFGYDIKGRTLGIFGGGRIGAATAERAVAFGMNLTYHSRRRNEALEALGATFVQQRSEFWPSADVISLHAPSTPETRNIIDATAIARMRKGAFLINTARGDLIDDDVVISALEAGRLGGVGFDVFRNEPDFDARYSDLPNAFLLPHIGSATHETRLAMGAAVIDTLEAHFRQHTPNP